jgi:hypothetical protein
MLYVNYASKCHPDRPETREFDKFVREVNAGRKLEMERLRKAMGLEDEN